MNHNNNNPHLPEQAFKQLHNIIYGIVYHMTKNEKDAEDITSNSFLRLFEKRDIGSMEFDHIKAFLKVAARNETFDFYRKKKLRQKFLNSHEATMLSLSDEDWFCKDIFVEYSDVLKEVINELPDRRREILMLKFYEDMSASAISEKLVIALNTVNNTLSKSYKSIRLKMLERGIKF